MKSMKDDKRAKKGAGREEERDVSESIALGKAVPKSKDGMFDQRLFNQDQVQMPTNLSKPTNGLNLKRPLSSISTHQITRFQGLATGTGNDDDYNVYDKALFKGNTQNYIYRKKEDEGLDEEELQKMIQTSTSKCVSTSLLT